MKVNYSDLHKMNEQDKLKLIAYLLSRVHSAETELSTLLMKDIKSKHFKEHGDFLAFHDLNDYYVLVEGRSLPPLFSPTTTTDSPMKNELKDRLSKTDSPIKNELIDRLSKLVRLFQKIEGIGPEDNYCISLPFSEYRIITGDKLYTTFWGIRIILGNHTGKIHIEENHTGKIIVSL